MKFVKIKEIQDIYRDNESVSVELDTYVNIDQISLIRELQTGLNVFIVGRDKCLKITDKNSIDQLCKECKIKRQTING